SGRTLARCAGRLPRRLRAPSRSCGAALPNRDALPAHGRVPRGPSVPCPRPVPSRPVPAGNRLFVEQSLYDYLVPLEYAVCCYWVGLHAEAIETNDRLLRSGMLPADLVARVIENRQFSLDALSPRIAESD